jgi:predicted amidohydrolase YtcJ
LKSYRFLAFAARFFRFREESMTNTYEAPDILLINGNIVTMNSRFSTAQAVAIRCSYIQAVGNNDELATFVGQRTRIIDLKGHTVIPGIIDAHAHMDREGLKKLQPGLENAQSINDILHVVKREAARKKPGEWVVTMPLGDPPNYRGVPDNLAEKRYPTRWELDRVSPNNPVYIRGIFGPWNVPPAVSVANSLALRLAGIDRHTKSPHPSVVIERDETEEPTGVIIDHNMIPVTEFSLMRVVPRFTVVDRVAALRESMRLYNSVGTTCIYESHGVVPEVLEAYKTIWDGGELTVRCNLVISPTWRSLKEAAAEMSRWGGCVSNFGFGDDWLSLCGYFIQLRGERHVARLRSSELPYSGWAGFAVSYNSYPQFLSLLRLAARHKVRVHTTASTAAELEDVLRAFETIHKEVPINNRRWMIEHVREVRPSQLDRLKRLGSVVETIPLTHIWLRGAPYIENSRQGNRLVPHQDFLEHGIPFGMGTDNKPYNPFHTLWSAVVRCESGTGTVIGPRQRLTRVQALYALTLGGAYLCGKETSLGSIEAGKFADLTVLSEDPLSVPEERLKDMHAYLTMVGGHVVHSSGDLKA